jgi:hypothetical protein
VGTVNAQVVGTDATTCSLFTCTWQSHSWHCKPWRSLNTRTTYASKGVILRQQKGGKCPSEALSLGHLRHSPCRVHIHVVPVPRGIGVHRVVLSPVPASPSIPSAATMDPVHHAAACCEVVQQVVGDAASTCSAESLQGLHEL